MINPKEFTQRDAINSLTGIKSSLSNIRKVVSLTYLLYLACNKKSSIVYAESKGNVISLKQEYKNFIKNFFGNEEILETIDDNPLLTSQIESLYVGLTLMFAFGRVSFENSSLSMTKERTGGNRYPKRIEFASNIMTFDMIMNAASDDSVKQTLLAWLQDKQLGNNVEQRISIFLNICIENNLFKLRQGDNDLYFQTEGIYKSLINSDEVSLESDEVVGPTRILNSMLRENLVPWLNYKKSLITINDEYDFNVKEYSDIITTSLNIRDIKIDNSTTSVPPEQTCCQYPLQQIYYGAPGTGKSHTINEQTEGESVIRTTFHPDSDYSTFVGAYKPTMGLLPICDELGQPMKIGATVLHKEQIIYEFVDQAFLQAYIKAWQYYAENADTPTKQYLIIEEINRGNCAQIFGDLFQLLDRNDHGFSVYPINADKDMKIQLAKAFKGMSVENASAINIHYKDRDVVSEVLKGEILLLPNNLYIWATMNTSDQSLFPIDSAFKRRWDWQYMPIGKGYDKHGEEIKWAIEGATQMYDWWSFLEKINAQIGEATQSEDKKLGFFFCKATNGEISAEKFVGKVIFYLWNDVFKNNGFEGPIFKDVDGTELSFGKFYKSDAKGNAIVQKDKVELFLNNLGVSIVGETEVEDEKLEAAITGGTVDRSKYAFNGSGKYGKSDLGRTIMEKFINEHPELTFDQIKQTFPDSMLNNIPGPGLIVKEDENLSSYSRYYVSGYTSSDGIKYHIYKQWTIGNVPNIIRFAESQNWSVEKL